MLVCYTGMAGPMKSTIREPARSTLAVHWRGAKSEFGIELFHLGTRRVAEVVPHLGLPARGPSPRHACENPSFPRAQRARLRPSRTGFRGVRARPGVQNPEFKTNEPLRNHTRKKNLIGPHPHSAPYWSTGHPTNMSRTRGRLAKSRKSCAFGPPCIKNKPWCNSGRVHRSLFPLAKRPCRLEPSL